jgi:hypothetical protein
LQVRTWQDKSAAGDLEDLKHQREVIFCPVDTGAQILLITNQYAIEAGFKGPSHLDTEFRSWNRKQEEVHDTVQSIFGGNNVDGSLVEFRPYCVDKIDPVSLNSSWPREVFPSVAKEP